MPKNVSFVLFLRLFCVKDSYDFNTNKHFNTLFWNEHLMILEETTDKTEDNL